MKIDPNKTWRKVEERLAVETDPILARNLQVVLNHMKAEAKLDLDGLIDTLSDDVHYHAYTGRDLVPELCPEGRDAVRKFYEDFAASGAHKLELDVDRLVVDRDCVLTEGVMRMAYPGSTLKLMGKDVDDPDAHYLYEARMAVLWPIDENGKILAEDTYTGGDGLEGIEGRKLSPADIGAASFAA
ncbi:MAG: nuclear transport factor 2 family protein [Myxococcota bacterium]